MTSIHTITSREFGQNVSSAKHLAREGPLFITDRGEPAFVLMNIGDYRTMAGGDRAMSLLELMDSLPRPEENQDFEISAIEIDLRPET